MPFPAPTPRLVRALQQAVPPERVFSVFAVETITHAFAAIWTQETGIPLDSEPEYYAAKFPHCTKETIRFRQTTISDVTYALRLATEEDIQDAAKLCFGFAAASVSLEIYLRPYRVLTYL